MVVTKAPSVSLVESKCARMSSVAEAQMVEAKGLAWSVPSRLSREDVLTREVSRSLG